MKRPEVKVGDLVRVCGRSVDGSFNHGFKSGQVVTVTSVARHLVGVRGVWTTRKCGPAESIHQVVAIFALKPAKQAMKKREVYASRRG